ncbi:MerR family DNA-binding protein, partial [Leptodesmis sp.]|uniref:MerR family DNA-binding protein n=1 Tax=Leptodesmis sp. TaxID=3100501 RepID=UPI0040534F54
RLRIQRGTYSSPNPSIVKDILALKDGRSLTCQALYERLASKLAQIEQQIQQLQTLQRELQPILKQCQFANPTSTCIALDIIPND